uniref:Uncharacterized protein n=1 Tax=Arundo donax TaxID=35708 RepID=A0A0A9BI04_ARUDO
MQPLTPSITIYFVHSCQFSFAHLS